MYAGTDKFVDTAYEPDYALVWDDPYSDDMMTDYMISTCEFRSANETTTPILMEASGTDWQGQADQRNLGDCYFVSAASAVAMTPSNIQDIFLTDDYIPENGIIAVNAYILGEPYTIVLDDLLPFNTTYDALSFTIQDAETFTLWATFLEKAWAKANANYELITSGNAVEVYEFLLGCPVEQYFKTNSFEPLDNNVGYVQATAESNAWSIITSALDNGYLVGLGNDVSNCGLVGSHAWSVISYHEFTTDATYQLLRIRNPWGIDSDYSCDFRDDDTTNWTVDNIA